MVAMIPIMSQYQCPSQCDRKHFILAPRTDNTSKAEAWAKMYPLGYKPLELHTVPAGPKHNRPLSKPHKRRKSGLTSQGRQEYNYFTAKILERKKGELFDTKQKEKR